jgi:hypothetical protein
MLWYLLVLLWLSSSLLLDADGGVENSVKSRPEAKQLSKAPAFGISIFDDDDDDGDDDAKAR